MMFFFYNCTVFLLCFTFFVTEDCLIVASDDLVDVIHTAVTQFDCIFLMIL